MTGWFDCEVCGLQHPREEQSCPVRHLVAQTGKVGLEVVPLNFRDPILLSSQLKSRVAPDV
jgi:hypothetical protein